MNIQIKARFTEKVLFEGDYPTIKACVEAAVTSRAVLRGADLRCADLSDADLSGAVLRGADLRCADLSDADLSGAKFDERQRRMFRDDLWAVLSASPHEVPALRDKVAAGDIDGSAYEGKCACLVGTIANAKKCHYTNIDGLEPDSGRPAEQWFMLIKPGDTPEKSEQANQVMEWIDQWLANVRTLIEVKA